MATREITTIELKKTTKEKLKKLGRKGETFDDVINKLMSKERTK